jgi:hypothetical protein
MVEFYKNLDHQDKVKEKLHVRVSSKFTNKQSVNQPSNLSMNTTVANNRIKYEHSD